MLGRKEIVDFAGFLVGKLEQMRLVSTMFYSQGRTPT
jgi:hypothetical protein